jgi:hypothetical protein
LRKLANALGYTNPSFLSDILKKKSRVSLDLLNRFLLIEDLDPLQRTYLLNLISIDHSTSDMIIELKKAENMKIKEKWTGVKAPIHHIAEPESLSS